jgi:sugar phosphate isomerase/epimerase
MKDGIAMSAPYLPPGTPFVVITGIPPQGNVRAAVDRTVEALKELGEFAAEQGMRIAFEPLSPINLHTDTAVWYLDQGLEVVDRVNHPAVGICVDTWNVWQTPNLLEVIRQCGNRILLVQLSDWKTPRSTADRYSLGDGEIPLRDIVGAIRKTGYAGPWVIEILSSLHLDGSLWKSDLTQVLRENRTAFENIWNETGS